MYKNTSVQIACRSHLLVHLSRSTDDDMLLCPLDVTHLTAIVHVLLGGRVQLVPIGALQEHSEKAVKTNASVRTMHTVIPWMAHVPVQMVITERCKTQSHQLISCQVLYTFFVFICVMVYRCDEMCPIGTYGFYCSQGCQCRNAALCSNVDGLCTCQPGWYGQQCELQCDSGYYGEQCRQECLCLNGASCHHVDGSCNCTDGWLGDNCSQSCWV